MASTSPKSHQSQLS